jgi:hypothetical protein
MKLGRRGRAPDGTGIGTGFFGIKAKATFLALLCAVIPAVLISVVSINTAREALEEVVKAELSDLTLHENEQLSSWIESAETDLETWSGLHTMQNVLTDDEDGTIATELEGLQRRYPRYGDLLVVNPSGAVVAAALKANHGKVVASNDFFSSAMSGQTYRSGVQRQPLINGRGIAFAAPILADYDTKTVVGVLVGIVDWRVVESTLRSVTVWGAEQDSDRKLVLRTSAGDVLFQ